MIEVPELGAKIAENPEESFWTKLKEKALKEIETIKHEITINEALIELAEKKIKERMEQKNGK